MDKATLIQSHADRISHPVAKTTISQPPPTPNLTICMSFCIRGFFLLRPLHPLQNPVRRLSLSAHFPEAEPEGNRQDPHRQDRLLQRDMSLKYNNTSLATSPFNPLGDSPRSPPLQMRKLRLKIITSQRSRHKGFYVPTRARPCRKSCTIAQVPLKR